jgi:hypothetical protein
MAEGPPPFSPPAQPVQRSAAPSQQAGEARGAKQLRRATERTCSQGDRPSSFCRPCRSKSSAAAPAEASAGALCHGWSWQKSSALRDEDRGGACRSRLESVRRL